jgi:hypothetical protein
VALCFLQTSSHEIDLVPPDPVLLCNDLGQISDFTREVEANPAIQSSGRASISIKEAARIAQNNNFMGLVCRSSLLVSSPCVILLFRLVQWEIWARLLFL